MRDTVYKQKEKSKLKKICVILAVLSIISVTAGISVNAEKTDFSNGLTALYNGLQNDEENGCFSAIALRQNDKTLDLTEFGCLIAKKDVPKNTVTAMKYALTVYACGVTDSVYDALDKDALKEAQSTSALVFSLHLYSIGYDTGMTKDEHIERLLDRAVASGGFPTVGETPDIDMTAMAVQALSPYKSEPRVADAIEKALSYMSSQQTETGAFKYFNSENCENCAQAILALSSLGIDAKTDERFIKNGVSVYDALLSYRLEDGSFEHVSGGGYNGAATAQAYCALVNNERLLPFYVIDPPETTVEYKAETVKQPVNMTVIFVVGICVIGLIVCVIMLILKRKRPVDYIIVAVITAALAVYAGVSGVASGKDYFNGKTDIKVSGYITFSVDCSLVSDKEMIKAERVGIEDGDTAYSVLIRICRQHGLTVVNSGSKITPYISGIGDLYEAEYGPTSGWGYKVNGKAPSVGAGSYKLCDGDVLEWLYVPDVSLLGD